MTSITKDNIVGTTESFQNELFSTAIESITSHSISNIFGNTFLAQQWYADQGDQSGGVSTRIGEIWKSYSGAASSIAIIDSGFQFGHRDLTAKLDGTRQAAAGTYTASNDHATQVAGVLGADATNDFGIVGVAHGAELTPVRLEYTTGTISRSDVAAAFSDAMTNDIINASWGYRVQFQDNFADGQWSGVADAIRTAASTGRDGLGTVTVFAAGNDRQYVGGSATLDGDNTNYHSLTNARQIITVAASDQIGQVASFSTPGASILVAAPGVSILTSGVVAGRETAGDGFETVSGTSFAAPIVSGVVALMLEANPELGYRDIQTILAMTATRPDASTFKINGASNWNGGGLTVNEDLGFGIVDAHAAVRLAETWTSQSTAANEKSVTLEIKQAGPSVLADGGSSTWSFTSPANAGLSVEWVEVDVAITHPHVGDLSIMLTSPSGHVSRLVSRPADGQNSRDNLNFTLTSAHFRGEDSDGQWTVRVTDAAGNGAGRVDGIAMRLFGDDMSDDTVHVITDAIIGMDDRDTLVDQTGDNTLNMSAVSAKITADLAEGGIKLDSKSLTIDAASRFGHIIGGEADDLLSARGASDAFTLAGGHGNDLVRGGNAADMLSGGAGHDRLLDFGTEQISDAQHTMSRLYEAAFKRMPDVVGFQGWSDALANGMSLEKIAEGFIFSTEFMKRYNGASNAEIIEQLYQNVLNRASEAEGKAYWLAKVEGGLPMASLLLGFSESQEFKTNMAEMPAMLAIQQSETEATDMVARAFDIALGRLPTTAERATWASAYLDNASITEFAASFVAADQSITLSASALASRMMSLQYLAESADRREAFIAETFADHNDTLEGGAGNDQLFGGLGADTFVFRQSDKGADLVRGLDAWDRLAFRDFGFTSSEDVMSHMEQSGRDVIFNHDGVFITFAQTTTDFIRSHGLIDL